MSKLEQQANLLFENIAGWENSTLQRIGKRINKYSKLSLADVKSINNIAVVKQDMEAITKELARVTGLNISQIEQMYGDLLTEQHLANKPLYDYRGKKFIPFAENRELQAITRAYAKTTGETMINLAKTKALCILDHNGNVKGLQKYYTDVLDKAVMQVSTGATDFHTAMRDTIVELGGSGVRVDYGGGVTRRLDTVVRQNLLWGAKQASIEYNDMIGEELGCDGYEVDWHSNPRPSHEFMQGKQFVVGKARTINGVHFDSFDEAEERLQDYGCLHYKTPIICGISEPRYSAEELKRLNEQNAKRYTVDGKEYSGYDITQMQRRLESSVRNEKTTRDLAKASGDNALVKRCNERIKTYQGKYEEISNITGIQGDKKRMSVPRATATMKNVTPTKVETPKPKNEWQNDLTPRGQVQEKIGEDDLYKYVANELKIDEQKAMDFVDATMAFTDDYYADVRAFQRGETIFSDVGAVSKISEDMEAYIKQAPRWNGGETFRGIAVSDAELASYTKGSIIDSMGGTSSWTNVGAGARDFAERNLTYEKPNTVIYHCPTQSKGTGIRHISVFEHENEVLVSSKARYEVVEVKVLDDGVNHVYLKELE